MRVLLELWCAPVISIFWSKVVIQAVRFFFVAHCHIVFSCVKVSDSSLFSLFVDGWHKTLLVNCLWTRSVSDLRSD